MLFCTECGAQKIGEEVFCQQCGTKILAVQPPKPDSSSSHNNAAIEAQEPSAKCVDEKVGELLPNYVFESASESDALLIRNHLKECRWCQYALEALALSKNDDIMVDIVPLLTSDQHAVWICRCVDGMTYAEIEAAFDVSENDLRVLFRECIERIHDWTAGKRKQPSSAIAPTNRKNKTEKRIEKSNAQVIEAGKNSGNKRPGNTIPETADDSDKRDHKAQTLARSPRPAEKVQSVTRFSKTRAMFLVAVSILTVSQLVSRTKSNQETIETTEASKTEKIIPRQTISTASDPERNESVELEQSQGTQDVAQGKAIEESLSLPDSKDKEPGPDSDGVYGPDIDQPAEPKKTSYPEYPKALREAGIEGDVAVEFVVSKKGRVENNTIVITRSTNEGFNEAVKRYVSKLRFTPANHNGEEVPQRIQQSFSFRLNQN